MLDMILDYLLAGSTFELLILVYADPHQWNVAAVKHWIQWAVKKFSLSGVNIKNFNFTGEQLLNLKNEEVVRYVPIDNSGFFMTHVELLRRTGSAGKHYEIV